MVYVYLPAGDLPHVVFVQPWRSDGLRGSSTHFTGDDYSKVQSAAYKEQCYDMYMHDSSVKHSNVEKSNQDPLQQVAQQVKHAASKFSV
jgi:hypothetical protein